MEGNANGQDDEAAQLADFADALTTLAASWRKVARLYREADHAKRDALRSWLADEIFEVIEDATETRNALLKKP